MPSVVPVAAEPASSPRNDKSEELLEEKDEEEYDPFSTGVEESSCAAAAPEGSASQRVRSRGRKPPVAAASDDVKCLGPEDLAKFKDAGQLAAKVSAETIKQSLLKLGLKCGGKPEERAQRLFLLKDKPLSDLPKSVFAAK